MGPKGNAPWAKKRSADELSPAAGGKRANVPAVDAPPDSAPEAQAVSTPPKPVLPTSCSDADVNVLDVMRGVIAYARHHLKEHMKGNPKYFRLCRPGVACSPALRHQDGRLGG